MTLNLLRDYVMAVSAAMEAMDLLADRHGIDRTSLRHAEVIAETEAAALSIFRDRFAAQNPLLGAEIDVYLASVTVRPELRSRLAAIFAKGERDFPTEPETRH